MIRNLRGSFGLHLGAGLPFTCRQDGDVDKSRPGVGGRLLEGLPVEPLGLLHVNGLHLLREAHLGVSLRQPDQRLQLSRVGGHHAASAADLPHVDVGLRKTAAELSVSGARLRSRRHAWSDGSRPRSGPGWPPRSVSG